jgi:hypothetical protein
MDHPSKAPAAPGLVPASRLYPVISTERIMQAVEQQKRITRELEDLCMHQRASALRMRRTTIRLMVGASGLCGLLALTFILLTLFQPEVLAHLLNLAGSSIALGFAIGEEIKAALAPLPSNSWFFSGVALALVALVSLWVRLMHYPREV